jgi:enoyl-CoA hydratase
MPTDYSDYEFLKVEVAERVATITINRPDSLNAVNAVVHHELEQIWIDVRADREINAIILTGAGRAFCAGGDVKGMAGGNLVAGAQKGKGRGRGPIAASNGRRLVDNFLDVEQPIIGAINGDAIGLGATLAHATLSWCRRRRASPTLTSKSGSSRATAARLSGRC